MVIALSWTSNLKAQDFAVKTNLIYDATATLNAGAEVGLAPKWTFELTGNLNAWTPFGEMRWKHWMAQPELRYWFCERFNGHFLGAHVLGGQYNFGQIPNSLSWWPFNTDLTPLNDFRFQGWAVGAGVAYGYSYILSRHWNIEFELGLGYIYTVFDVYQCKDCGKKVKDNEDYHYVGPTKAAVNLIYEF